MRNKAHLTREGLEEIKKIKGTMKSLQPQPPPPTPLSFYIYYIK